MPALIDAIEVKRKMYFEFENAPYYCLDVEVSTPTARGGQTLVRLKMRNLLTRAVFDKTFKASDKFKEPDLETVEASYLYSDGEGSYFLDQETFDTITPDQRETRRRPRLPARRRHYQDRQVQRQPHRTATAREGRISRRPTPSPAPAAIPPAAPLPSTPGWRQASKSASPSSSKKARRSRSTPKPANSPAAPSRR